MENCLFCKIINGEIPCYKIYEDEDTLAFLDITNNPEGHTLVVPKKHSKNILDTQTEVLSKVIATVQRVSQHYISIGYAEGINVYINNERSAGQEVMHLHIHILPRISGDNIDFARTDATSNQSLEKVCEKLKLNF